MAAWGKEQAGLWEVGAATEERRGHGEPDQDMKNRKSRASVADMFLQVNLPLSPREGKGHENT